MKWFRRRPPSPPPLPPQGVRIIKFDGTEMAVQPMYVGKDDTGRDIWEVAEQFDVLAGDTLAIDVLPAHSAVNLSGTYGEET
jgi:hypothetical protein